jgi:energy-coupling factor transporter ATP-binding protein EcfA2
MTTPDELLPMVDRILKLVGEDGAALERWSQTVDGQKVIQYVVQIGKYNTNLGEGKDISIGDRLDRKLLEEIRDSLRAQLPAPPLEIDWPQVSRTLLEERLQLTTNPMTRGEHIAYQVEQVYVPLGLMERKKVPRRKQDVAPEQGSALYQEDWQPERSPENSKSSQEAEQEQAIEITQRFEHEQFLEQVLQQGQSPKSQGKRIAVIGEPGAGKTTLLQQIARWAAATFPDAIVIWVSLADLSQTKLKEYIFETWLTAVVEQCDRSQASDSIKDTLIQQCNQGRVWLLLDGLDEMPVSGNPLTNIQRQLQEGGWLQQARILLTCRLNLWDGDRNALTQFDTYRTLEFAYPDQVEQFIRQWFAPRSKAELGEALGAALKESGRERMRDLVKNPLRLTLLCFSWYLQQGQLPDTQAELYQRFVDRIYEWKQEQFPTTPTQRQQLNRALAELSREAIDNQDKRGQLRFRLHHAFVSQYLDVPMPQSEGTFLELALRVGWLNRVGLDTDDPERSVYAFLHATFEEYFAALAADCQFFLNHVPGHPNAANASYRVFEPQWRQVFLLWLGREDVDKQQKEALIQALVTFKDGCKDFYGDRAFLLAAAGITEFKDCAIGHTIVLELLQWQFGYAGRLKRFWATQIDSVRSKARENSARIALGSIDSQQVIPQLLWLLKATESKDIRSSVTTNLGEIAMGNKIAIKELGRIVETTQEEDIWNHAVDTLLEIDPGNEIVIRQLRQMLETEQDEDQREQIAESLVLIDPGNPIAIRELVRYLEVRCLEDSHDWGRHIRAARILGEITPGNETTIRALVQASESTNSRPYSQDFIHSYAASELVRIDPTNQGKRKKKRLIHGLFW